MTAPHGTALILGLGRFGGGRAAAAWLGRNGYRLRVADSASPKTLVAAHDQLAHEFDGIDWRLGAAQDESLLDGVDLCVVNPAIRPGHPLLAAATRRGVPLTQETNLFLEAFPGRVVLVTGTNGKSTAATLIAAALRRNGHAVELGGNIGRSLLDTADSWDARQFAVLEISSAQLTRIDPAQHGAEIAVTTRITKDHVDWHGSLDAYRAAKTRALAAARGFAIHLADDPIAAAAPITAIRIPVHLDEPPTAAVGVDDGWIVSTLERAPGRILHRDASRLLGAFHVENLGLAAATALAAGGGRHETGLATSIVRPLRHRLQLLVQRGNRRVYGNAVSTDMRSTVSALASLDGPVHWVGGGKSKDGDFSAVAEAVAPRIASAHLFGAAAPCLGPILEPRCTTTTHDAVTAALDAAWRHVRPGEALLFSPAFASFDQFENFRARAAVFEDWIRRIST